MWRLGIYHCLIGFNKSFISSVFCFNALMPLLETHLSFVSELNSIAPVGMSPATSQIYLVNRMVIMIYASQYSPFRAFHLSFFSASDFSITVQINLNLIEIPLLCKLHLVVKFMPFLAIPHISFAISKLLISLLYSPIWLANNLKNSTKHTIRKNNHYGGECFLLKSFLLFT